VTEAEFRWLSSSRGLIVTTRSKHSHLLMLSPCYREREDDPAIALTACWATGV
jgi:hypothetical protein